MLSSFSCSTALKIVSTLCSHFPHKMASQHSERPMRAPPSPPPPPPPSPFSQQSPQDFSRNSSNAGLFEHGLFPISEGRTSAASFLHSYFLRVISVTILWFAHNQKVPQASKQLRSAICIIGFDVWCACQVISTFISSDSKKEESTLKWKRHFWVYRTYAFVPSNLRETRPLISITSLGSVSWSPVAFKHTDTAVLKFTLFWRPHFVPSINI